MKILNKIFAKGVKGFTLIELMITVAIVALLLALALPSYKQFIRKSNRGDATQQLMNWANLQEIWRANNALYADDVASPNGIPVPVDPTNPKYTYSLGAPNPPTAVAYVLRACASTADQRKDQDRGVNCGDCAADIANALTITQAGVKSPANCW